MLKTWAVLFIFAVPALIGLLTWLTWKPEPIVERRWAISAGGQGFGMGTSPMYSEQECHSEALKMLEANPKLNFVSCDAMVRRAGSPSWQIEDRLSFGRGTMDIHYVD
jgi:hypothetical protein